MSTMTRGETEAVGWRLFPLERSKTCPGLVFMVANNNRHRLYSWGLSEQEAVDSILSAITAIERYGAAVKLLEEIRRELADAVEDVDDERQRDTVKSLLAKLGRRPG